MYHILHYHLYFNLKYMLLYCWERLMAVSPPFFIAVSTYVDWHAVTCLCISGDRTFSLFSLYKRVNRQMGWKSVRVGLVAALRSPMEEGQRHWCWRWRWLVAGYPVISLRVDSLACWKVKVVGTSDDGDWSQGTLSFLPVYNAGLRRIIPLLVHPPND